MSIAARLKRPSSRCARSSGFSFRAGGRSRRFFEHI